VGNEVGREQNGGMGRGWDTQGEGQHWQGRDDFHPVQVSTYRPVAHTVW